MSRPVQAENTITANRRGIIDFVGAPMNTPYYAADDAYMQAAYPPMGPQPMGPGVYTMAGYPQGPMPGAAYMQAPYTTTLPAAPQAYMQAYAGSPYYSYPVGATAIQEQASRPVAAQSQISEEALQQKVDSKIEAIMSAHKTDILSQQITRLTDKVQKLSNNIEYQQSAGDRAGLSAASTDPSENEMSRRLRKLAAESSRRASSESTPHF
jgi:hypothetical protein